MQRMPKYGRRPDTLKVLPGLSPILGSTEQEAKRKEAELDELILAFTPRVVSLLDRAERDGLTVLACANLVAKSRSHGTFVGTPEQLADHMQLWFTAGGCDGFNIMPAYFPDELDVFVDQAVPVLQRRGLFRTEYEGTMLRDHLGLARPKRSRDA
jgi:alkanesulfonate monooxygenase SsuD/methylene tetrahydromethanopterin reductase-like flavin-dependent oxidoreductase (luciferase family)